jgi:hypothetical protein
MAAQENLRLDESGSDVLIDVTSLIGAEDFILSQNRRRAPVDPFARQCFAEVVQTIILMSNTYVAHPTLFQPRAVDFGNQPRFLRTLVRQGLVKALKFEPDLQALALELEQSALRDLASASGMNSVTEFIRQARICDIESGRRNSLSARLLKWSEFQMQAVHKAPDHHTARIPTQDGIEDDSFGQWARAASIVLGQTLDAIAAPGSQSYVMATLARGIKYRIRAEVNALCYQSHPMRRDFLLTFDMARDRASSDEILNLIKVVRGIHKALANADNVKPSFRPKILELELPLLGGRLWADEEVDVYSDSDWIELIAERIAEYRLRASDLRNAIAGCITEVDFLRFSRDVEEVKNQLLARLGLRQVELSQVERQLVEGVALRDLPETCA